MEPSAVDAMVMAEMEEKLGREAFRKLVKEVAPDRINVKRVGFYIAYILTVTFWIAVAPPLFTLDMPVSEVYPIALANILGLKQVYSMLV